MIHQVHPRSLTVQDDDLVLRHGNVGWVTELLRRQRIPPHQFAESAFHSALAGAHQEIAAQIEDNDLAPRSIGYIQSACTAINCDGSDPLEQRLAAVGANLAQE